MDFTQIWNILSVEGEVYLRNLAVPLTVTLIASISITKGLRNYELGRLRSKHRDKVIEEILKLSYTYNEFLDMFHIRSKYNPQLIETISEKMALEIANLSGLSAVYFAKKNNIEKLKMELKEIRSLYTLLVGRKEPFQPVSPTDYIKYQEEFSIIITDMMKIVRHSKLI